MRSGLVRTLLFRTKERAELESSAVNKASLKSIDSALFVVALDTYDTKGDFTDKVNWGPSTIVLSSFCHPHTLFLRRLLSWVCPQGQMPPRTR